MVGKGIRLHELIAAFLPDHVAQRARYPIPARGISESLKFVREVWWAARGSNPGHPGREGAEHRRADRGAASPGLLSVRPS